MSEQFPPRGYVTKREDGGLTHIILYEKYNDLKQESYLSEVEHQAIVSAKDARIRKLESALEKIKWGVFHYTNSMGEAAQAPDTREGLMKTAREALSDKGKA